MLKGKILIGDNTSIYPYAELKTRNSEIEIGKNCQVHEFAFLLSVGGIKVGDDVRISHHVSLIASSHHFEQTDIPIWQQGLYGKGIIIGDDALIGAGTRILEGITRSDTGRRRLLPFGRGNAGHTSRITEETRIAALQARPARVE